MHRSFYSLWSSQSITNLASSLFMLTLIAAAANSLYPRIVHIDKRVNANSLVSTSM